MNDLENKNDIPDWNLSTLFAGLDSAEYKKALADYTASMDSIDVLLKKAEDAGSSEKEFDFCGWLKEYIDEDNKCHALEGTLGGYAYIIYSTDTTNTEYLNNISKVEQMGLRSQQQSIKFAAILTANQNCLAEFFKRFADYAEYEFLLNEVIDDAKHKMSAAEENLATDLQRTGGDAWGRLHEQIISTIHDENGKTFNGLRNDAYSADPELRKASWKKEVALLKQNEIAFAASLNNLKGETVTLNKRRNWNCAIDRALASSRMQRKTLDALIGAIEDSLPMWREYLQTKAALLRKAGATASKSAGTADDKGLAFYDLFAPLAEVGSTGASSAKVQSSGSTDTACANNAGASQETDGGSANGSLFTKTWTFSEAKDYILKEYNSFSADMGAFAKQAFENNWIDARVHPGKVGGAYDQDFALGHQSRILSNFTGAFSDIITLAHELGHAYHFSCMKDKAPCFFDYPMTLAETASTFAETIVKQDAIANCDGFDRMNLIELDLQDTCQVLVDILCRFYFEMSVFEERQNGELNAEDFCRLMDAAQEKSYGCGLSKERHSYMWAVKSHYYSTGLDFYNFPYAFGQLFAAGLYERSKKEGPEFARTYASLLADTGSMSCEDLCKKAGFDITTKEFWKSGIEMYAKELELLKKYLD